MKKTMMSVLAHLIEGSESDILYRWLSDEVEFKFKCFPIKIKLISTMAAKLCNSPAEAKEPV